MSSWIPRVVKIWTVKFGRIGRINHVNGRIRGNANRSGWTRWKIYIGSFGSYRRGTIPVPRYKSPLEIFRGRSIFEGVENFVSTLGNWTNISNIWTEIVPGGEPREKLNALAAETFKNNASRGDAFKPARKVGKCKKCRTLVSIVRSWVSRK